MEGDCKLGCGREWRGDRVGQKENRKKRGRSWPGTHGEEREMDMRAGVV